MKRKVKISAFFVIGLSLLVMATGCGGKKLDTTISLPSGEYAGAQEVVLTNEGEASSCKIYYTLDGTEPNKDSFVYANPLEINYDSTLKAVTICDGTTGAVAEATYTIITGTITFTGNDGKEASYTIDMAPSGDNAVFFNADNYNYLG